MHLAATHEGTAGVRSLGSRWSVMADASRCPAHVTPKLAGSIAPTVCTESWAVVGDEEAGRQRSVSQQLRRPRRLWSGTQGLLMCFWVGLVGCGRIGYDLQDNAASPRPGGGGPGQVQMGSLDGGVLEPGAGGPSADLPSDASADLLSDASTDLPSDASTDLLSDASTVLPSDASTDLPSDASTDLPSDASTDLPSDASTDVPGLPPAGVRISIQDVTDGVPLRDHAVRVVLDTQAFIAAGQLDPECQNLSLLGGADCTTPQPFFLSEQECGSASSELWVAVDALADGQERVLALDFTAQGGVVSDGSAVFSFFDGFDGAALDTARWVLRGEGSALVSGGVLQTTGAALLQSQSAVVSAGESVVGARIAALSQHDTDVELGVGEVFDSIWLWAFEREWTGFTFVSWNESTYAFDGPAASACDRLTTTGSVAPPLGESWVDVAPGPASFLLAEFGYSIVEDQVTGWLETSRGVVLTYTGPAGCSLPANLPLLLSLDHYSDAPIAQRLDYVYVRAGVPNEPDTQVLLDSSRCASGE